MAATRILALLLLLLCLRLEKPIMQESLPNFSLSVQKSCCVDPGVRDDAVFLHGPRSCVRFVTRRSRHARLRYPVLVWHKHGLLTIASSEQDICLDICICMNVESNPGPGNRFECESHTTRLITYTKQDFLRLRKFPASRLKPMPAAVQKLKMFNLYRYRGSRTPRLANCFWICSTKVFIYKYMQSGQNQEQSSSGSGAGSRFE